MPEESEESAPAPLESVAAKLPPAAVPEIAVLSVTPRQALSTASVVGAPQAIVVEEEALPTRAIPAARPRRSEFRQLFSKLRRG
jgi:hypothetical protein